jgi:hypothetical protein
MNSATPYFKNTIGLDFASPIKSWILRGEAACNITTDYEQFMYIPNPDIAYIIGIEHNFWGVVTILQYVGRHTFDFIELQIPILTNPNDPIAKINYAIDIIDYESTLFNRKMFYQQKKTNHAVMLLLRKAFNYNSWNIELGGYYNITSDEFMVRPKVIWEITDELETSLGANYMTGSDNSIFEYSSSILNGVFVELKTTF